MNHPRLKWLKRTLEIYHDAPRATLTVRVYRISSETPEWFYVGCALPTGEILPTVDAVMVARGDLGIEIPAERVPVVQKQIVSACRERGIPVIVVGLMVILRNSFKARRQFVRLHHAHPRMISPIRRLLRRDPQILKMSWHQALKIERLLAPKGLRFMVRSRRLFRRRR